MRICHVTAHLPPDQGANALLPVHLGEWARAAGDDPCYIAYPPRSLAVKDAAGLAHVEAAMPGPVTWLTPRPKAPRIPGAALAASAIDLLRIRAATRRVLAAADVVHVHSNGFLPEAVAWLASHRPLVLTLYGTEIWHYRRKPLVDLFTRAYESAAEVTFYSRGLLDRALECGLMRDSLSVVYPPVAPYFQRRTDAERRAARAELGLRERFVLINVKRLHPLAGQRHLIDAMPAVLAARPDTRLVICGTGALRELLEARARELGVAAQVTFTGLIENRQVALYQGAADLFVLPSDLEALPTVAIEALASGTPVVSTDNPGGLELQRLFGDDVAVVPRRNPEALAAAITAFLSRVRRTAPDTDRVLGAEFGPPAVAARFTDVYRRAAARGVPGSLA